MMSRAGDTSIVADVAPRRRVVVDVILLLMRNGRILLRERANTGYGDGAYSRRRANSPTGKRSWRRRSGGLGRPALRSAARTSRSPTSCTTSPAAGASRSSCPCPLDGPARVARRVLVSGRGPADEHARLGPGGAAQLRRRDALLHLPGVRARGHGRNQLLPRGQRFRRVERVFGESDNINGLFEAGESHGANGISETKGRAPRNGSPSRRIQACGAAFWADEPTASWPSPPPAKLARRGRDRPGPAPRRRHAAPRSSGHHGGAGQHARASLTALAFG